MRERIGERHASACRYKKGTGGLTPLRSPDLFLPACGRTHNRWRFGATAEYSNAARSVPASAKMLDVEGVIGRDKGVGDGLNEFTPRHWFF